MEFKNVLITGGCGFIGSHFVNYMVDKYPDTNFVNIDRIDYCSDLSNIMVNGRKNYKFVKGDIVNMDLLHNIIKENSIDCVVHMAAQTHVDNSFKNTNIFVRDNITASVNILELCRIHKEIKRLVHVSTDEVYGEIGLDDEFCTVNMKLNPTNPYSASKASAEYFVKCYQKCFNIPVIITRGNNVYGPGQYHEKLIPKFIKLLLEGDKCTIHGTGQNLRNFIHVDDTVSAFDVILNKGALGAIYNIGTNNEFSVMDVAKKLIYILKDTDQYDKWIEYIEDRSWNDLRYGINNKKLIELGWSEKKPDFDDGLKECIRWYMNKISRIKPPVQLPYIVTQGKPGCLVPVSTNDISTTLKLSEPFRLDRLFYINTDCNGNTTEDMRGNHANRYIREIMVCVDGSCDINLFDGKDWYRYSLNKNNCIYVGEYIWIEYGNFKDNCLLMVLVQDLEKVEDCVDKIYDLEEYMSIRS